MIIELTVENFRSIRDEQTFSLSTENPKGHLESHVTESSSSGGFGILKSVGIYGANASGKSNLLLAFRALRYLTVETGKLGDGDPIPCYEPYLLSKKNREMPVVLEIEFVLANGIRYLYRVAFLRQKVVEERLSMFQTPKESLVFKRTESDSWDTIRFGALYKGGKKRFPFFGNQTYLSVAGSRADAPEMIRGVYNFLRRDLVLLGVHEGRSPFSPVMNQDVLEKSSRLLSLVDTGISNVVLEEKTLDEDSISFPNAMPENVRDSMLRRLRQRYLFSHQAESGEQVQFEGEVESSGTMKMFELAPLIISAFETGGVLIIDELGNSMHPFMAELIIKLFNDPDVNPGKAQLVFTTHNVNLMTPELLRRDQIWFSEKTDGASRFFSLDDFDKRRVTPKSPYGRWYAEGRLGAVPHIDYQGIVRLLGERVDNAEA